MIWAKNLLGGIPGHLRIQRIGFPTVLAALLMLSGCGSQTSRPTNANSFAMAPAVQSQNSSSNNSPSLSALHISEASVTGGASPTITVTLAHPAPAGGVKVAISSSEPEAVQAPASVEFAEGQSSVSFAASTTSVPASVSVALRAQLGESVAGSNLAVLPPATAPFTVSVLPSTVTIQQGKSGSATVTTKVNSGFDHSLQLKTSGEPSGVTASLNPQVIAAPGSGTSKLTLDVASSAQAGSYPVTVTASEGTDSASAKTTLKVISGTGDPNATFKGCWYHQGGHRYQAVDVSVGHAGTYPFNAILYSGTSCNPNDWADQFGFGELINFGDYQLTFWFSDFADQSNMSALWYVGDQASQCVNYSTAPTCGL